MIRLLINAINRPSGYYGVIIIGLLDRQSSILKVSIGNLVTYLVELFLVNLS